MEIIDQRLYLNEFHFRYLLERLGPSLGLWRGAEIAALREQSYPRPLLDLGCGDGLVTAMATGKVEIGLDPDGEALKQAAGYGIYEHFVAEAVEDARLHEGRLGGS